MTNPSAFSTEQEAFWSGSFGDAYTDRNDGDAIARSNLLFWGGVKANRPDYQLLRDRLQQRSES